MILNRNDGNWEALSEQVRQWLNEYVPPHHLVSISFYEEQHPNVNMQINAIITHRGGANPVPLA